MALSRCPARYGVPAGDFREATGCAFCRGGRGAGCFVNKARLFLLVIGTVTCAAASAATFDLDPSKTQIGFTVHDPLHTVHGTFNLKRGKMQLEPGTGKASGEMVIDIPSGISGNGSRDKRMHKEILESQKYPEAVFTPDRVRGSIAAEGTSEIDVHGSFRIHGADHEITIHFQ